MEEEEHLEEVVHDGVLCLQLLQLAAVLVPVLLVDRHVRAALQHRLEINFKQIF